MQLNQCGFPNCAQYFASQYDLTAHIEYTHIPVIEEDVKRKTLLAASVANGEQPVQPAPMNLPLSYYSRVFRTAYRPNPIKPEPLKVSFNHYKRRSQRDRQIHPNHMASRILRDMMARQGRHRLLSVTIEEAEKRLMDVDFEECGPENNEVRFRCAIVDCNKRYKSMFALRVHMKIVHNVVVSEDAKSLTNYPSEDVKPNISALQQAMQHQQIQQQHHHHQQIPTSAPEPSVSSGTPTTGTPAPNTPLAQGSPLPGAAPTFGNPATNTTSYKCTYCSKRYKTSSGLSNHMMSSHQKISDVQDAPTPQVVEQLISQVRMQRQQQEQNSMEQGQQRITAPPQTPQSQNLANLIKSSSHVRSFSVTTTQQPIRFSQQHYQVNLDNQPSTGQVLQMQMQHQKRMKQMQEQQAAQQAAAAAAAQQQQQQQQQQGMQMQQAQFSSSPINQMGQQGQQQQQMGPLPSLQHPQQQQQQQQYHQMPPQPQHSPYPQQQQMHHQMVQHSPHHYQQQQQQQQYQQQHQQSPQFPSYQQSPQQQQAPPPQRSPIPLSQSLPPLNSMTQQQRASMQQMPPPNSGPLQYSPPNQQGFGSMMSSPPNNSQQMTPSQQPPPYNM